MRPLILMATVAVACSSALAQPALLSPSPATDAGFTARQAEILRILRAERGVSAVQIVVADVALLARDAAVTVPLPDRPAVAIEGSVAGRRADGIASWTGRAEAARPGAPARAQAAFVVRDGWLTGTLRGGEAVYTVRPLTGGLHAIARVDPDAKPTHDADYPAFERQEHERIARERRSAPAESYTLIGARTGGRFVGVDVRPFAAAEIPLAIEARGTGSAFTLRWDAGALPSGLPVWSSWTSRRASRWTCGPGRA